VSEPDYNVRVSARAKRMQLEVVIPRGCDPRLVPGFVREHRDWLRQTLDRLERDRGHYPGLNELLPTTISFPALAEKWRVRYRPGSSRGVVLASPKRGELVLMTGRADGVAVRSSLRGWLRERAGERLIPWLCDLSDELEIPFGEASVRAQKTRWGSCSARKNISLNCNLLFLPAAVVRYLLVHELCHTVHMNHSRRYWALVAENEPRYRQLDAELRYASRYIPIWAYPE
jgi:predicted metal-dependent hydrolase